MDNRKIDWAIVSVLSEQDVPAQGLPPLPDPNVQPDPNAQPQPDQMQAPQPEPAQEPVPAPETDQAPMSMEFSPESDIAGSAGEDNYPKPDFTVQQAVNTLKGIQSNWTELRYNFPPEDKENRDKITELGDVLNGILVELQQMAGA